MIAYEELDKDRDYFYFNLPVSKLDLSTSDDAAKEDDDIQSESYSTGDADTEANTDINSLEYVYEETNLNIPESPGLVGTWSGFYYYGFFDFQRY
jgi:hypothetical protein